MTNIALQAILLIILICLSAFFSGSETALFSLSKIRVKRLQQENRRNAKLIARLLDQPNRLLISILVGNTLANIFASSTASVAATGLIGEKEGLLFSIAIMTFLILIFGEITPKGMAINDPERISMLIAPYINAFSGAIFPIRRALCFITDFFVKRFSESFKLKKETLGLTGQLYLEKAVSMGRSEGEFDVEEERMFKGVFEFGQKKVRDMMRPRKEIIAFEADTPLDKIKSVIKKEELSRIPVYAKELDNIMGILYAKDLIIASEKSDTVDIKEILRKPFFVPCDMKLVNLFRELRSKRIHIGLVKDDSKLVGLVTLEDLLEEIVGEIKDVRG